MKVSRFGHYVRRFTEIGPSKALEVMSYRVQNSFFEQYTRYQAERKRASHTWISIAQKHRLGAFEEAWADLKKRSFTVLPDLYTAEIADTKKLVHEAQKFAHNCFDILGSRDQCLMTMPWHSDFRLRYQHPDADYLFDKSLFYKDFMITPGLTDRLIKDIKVPWELSRFQHLLPMGIAYSKSHDAMYAQSFMEHVQDWMDENPFLLGPNWVCPMDVGIRALNWVVAFHYFKDSQDIPVAFWQRFVCSLYDHMIYLENNWEVYAVTSNHYLSDLIGYYYLTWFFADWKGISKKRDWCYKEFVKEFEKQVFEEGADHEGSTRYHVLVTEIFYHFYLMCQEHTLAIPASYVEKLQRMFSFIDHITIGDQYRLKIGDDDSGKILYYGITQRMVATIARPEESVKTFYKQFGLAVLKNKDIHVTLRHHAYSLTQPSGHFHNDVGSVTLGVRGIPVLVDPGSYVYTPSAYWRNYFRSAAQHNTFHIQDVEPILFDDRLLFNLAIPTHTPQASAWTVHHNLYSMSAERHVQFASDYSVITLTDTWQEDPGEQLMTSWNFTLAPGIEPRQVQGGWALYQQDQLLVTLASEDITFTVHDGWYATAYGTKQPTKQLRATAELTMHPTVITLQIQ